MTHCAVHLVIANLQKMAVAEREKGGRAEDTA